MVDVFLSCSLLYLLRQRLLLSWGLSSLNWLASQRAPRLHCFHLPDTGVTGDPPHPPGFYVNSILLLLLFNPHACIFPTTHLPSPMIFFEPLIIQSLPVKFWDYRHGPLYLVYIYFQRQWQIEWLSLTHPSPQSLTCIIWPFIDKRCELLP